ncbi:Hypothetical protein FKW44_022882 [Caligus rogercresseyi]|uniref:Uncharacterized protein n=1 Tax=Caligus rogercresseyi TaxID=217165 RepID=A0A7T8GN68_CALRO|nr:Hypothetical protein FKW44_022882 [Caligus rogercresseyi]
MDEKYSKPLQRQVAISFYTDEKILWSRPATTVKLTGFLAWKTEDISVELRTAFRREEAPLIFVEEG